MYQADSSDIASLPDNETIKDLKGLRKPIVDSDIPLSSSCTRAQWVQAPLQQSRNTESQSACRLLQRAVSTCASNACDNCFDV